MRYSNLFGKTVKTVPSDLSATSHKLLYQGGFIRQVAAGRYAYLPLGFKVREKIQKIIHDEMKKLGSQQISTPIFHPIEIWQATNRDKAFGGEMHILEDHHGSTFAIGATAEGVMVEIVKKFQPSYRDLPIYVHQFVGKFRDEKRPKGGLLRVREFMMKDAYSFDSTEEAAFQTYEKFYDAYLNIAEKIGLKVHPVLADSGAIGGDHSHEFLVESDIGEAYGVLCNSCDYAAQLERAESVFETYEQDNEQQEVKEFWDETVVNCELLAQKMGVPVHVTTKTIMFKADGAFVAVMIRGDFDVNETKLKNYLDVTELELAADQEILELTGAKVGFVGPMDLPEDVKVIADLSCEGRVNFEAGGNKTGLHLYNLNFDRDLPTPIFIDLRETKDGEKCTQCNGTLRVFKGIEWGHCFKLDHVYSEPQKGYFVDEDGVEKPIWMGSYGIGLGRSVATVIETNHDENGIIWPENIAPFNVHLVGINLEDEQTLEKATALYEKLTDAGVEVLFDDRVTTRAGEKFSDADLIGCPYRVVVSKKTEDKYEVKKRNEDKVQMLTETELLNLLTN